MSTGERKIDKIGNSNGIKKTWVVLSVVAVVLICTLISWGLVSGLATSKSGYTASINTISTEIGHMQDTLNGLNSFTGYQNTSLQTQFDDIASKIQAINNDMGTNDAANASAQNNVLSDINAIQKSLASVSATLSGVGAETDGLNTSITDLSASLANLKTDVTNLGTAINDPSTGLKTQVNNLTTTVNGICGLQIIPTISSSSTGPGTISLAITSSQTVTSQTVAFNVEFIAKTDYALATSFDNSMQALAGTSPVTLKLGSSTGVAVTTDHIAYSLYYASSAYHLGSVTFTTPGTSITKGTQTKTLSFNWAGTTAYDVVITPIFEAATNSQGGAISTW